MITENLIDRCHEVLAEVESLDIELEAEIAASAETGYHSKELTDKMQRLLNVLRALRGSYYLIRRTEDPADLERFCKGLESLRQEICLTLN